QITEPRRDEDVQHEGTPDSDDSCEEGREKASCAENRKEPSTF
ncbi:hypothetical protein DBR06_SOUSAS70110001, partial [Sousa chinensis]